MYIIYSTYYIIIIIIILIIIIYLHTIRLYKRNHIYVLACMYIYIYLVHIWYINIEMNQKNQSVGQVPPNCTISKWLDSWASTSWYPGMHRRYNCIAIWHYDNIYIYTYVTRDKYWWLQSHVDRCCTTNQLPSTYQPCNWCSHSFPPSKLWTMAFHILRTNKPHHGCLLPSPIGPMAGSLKWVTTYPQVWWILNDYGSIQNLGSQLSQRQVVESQSPKLA